MKDLELDKAAGLLPIKINEWVMNYNNDSIEEIRLRCGKKVQLCTAGKVLNVENALVFSHADMNMLLERATRSSLHSASESIRHGYITAVNGIRIGLCGTAVVNNKEITAVRDFSSANIRISHEKHGIADELIPLIVENNRINSTLIISPPGLGKTTLLREIIRKISDKGINCGIADERGEIAAVQNGICGFDVGRSTDVISLAPKYDAVMMLLRTMNPKLVAMDEISEEKDMQAVKSTAGCGVSILATIHGTDLEDIRKRQPVRDLLDNGIFENAVIISLENEKRVFKPVKLTE